MMTRFITKKIFSILTIILLFTLVMAACSSNKPTTKNQNDDTTSESATPQPGGTITIGTSQEPDTLDIHKTGMSVADDIDGNIGGTLLSFDPDSMELKPNLAESYNVSADGKTLTFKIRQGVTFQDGTPLTSKSFKDTFDRIMNPATGATVAANFVSAVQSVTTPDDQTLVIKLKEPSAPFLSNLTTGYMQPLSLESIKKYGKDYGRNPVGVGPWKFEHWVTGQSITLTRNDAFKWPASFYKNQGKTYPDKLVYKFITDPQTMLAALDSGSIDILASANAKDAKRYRDNNKFNVLEADQQGLGLFLEMNLENDLVKDINVRKAINLAIDKNSIIKAVLDGEGEPAYGPLPPTIFGYDANVKNYGYKYNKNQAMKLLEDSGWKKNSKGIMEKDGKTLQLTLSIYATQSQAAQIVQAMLKDIGIDIKLQTMEPATLIEKATKGQYDLAFLSYTYNDPDILYLLFHSSQIGGLNHIRVKNPELDVLLEKGRTTMDTEERKKIYADIQKTIVDQAYWAPIYSGKVFYIANKKVHDVKLTPTGLLVQDGWVSK